MLLQDRALQALDNEAIGPPGVPRPGAGMANPQALHLARLIERAFLNSGPPSVSTRWIGQPARR